MRIDLNIGLLIGRRWPRRPLAAEQPRGLSYSDSVDSTLAARWLAPRWTLVNQCRWSRGRNPASPLVGDPWQMGQSEAVEPSPDSARARRWTWKKKLSTWFSFSLFFCFTDFFYWVSVSAWAPFPAVAVVTTPFFFGLLHFLLLLLLFVLVLVLFLILSLFFFRRWIFFVSSGEWNIRETQQERNENKWKRNEGARRRLSRRAAPSRSASARDALPGFTGFYGVLLGFTGFYWVLLGFTRFYWVLLGFT